jgi:glycogen operon protein
MQEEHWNDPHAKCLGMVLDGRAQESGIKQRGTDETLLIVMNAHHDVVNFKFPESPEGRRWARLLDTNDPALHREHYDFGAVYEVTGRSLLLFLLERENSAHNAGHKAPRQ